MCGDYPCSIPRTGFPNCERTEAQIWRRLSIVGFAELELHSVTAFFVVVLLTNGALAQTPKTDRELAGLNGKARSVIAQHAKLAEEGKSLAGPQQLSYNERCSTLE